MSFDTVEENKAFADAEAFPYRLLSDPEKVAGAAFDTIRAEGEPYAQFGVARRLSYLIDPDRVIRRAYEVADVNAHAEEVLGDLRSLKGA
jgi:peroxiredoxin Q/BCP